MCAFYDRCVPMLYPRSLRSLLQPRPALAAAAAASALVLAGCGHQPLQIAPSTAGFSAAVSTPDPTIPQPVAPLANIRNLDLRTTILRDTRVPADIRGAVQDCVQCGLGNPQYVDITKDRVEDVVVPILAENGSLGTIAYTVVDGRPRLVFAHVGSFSWVDVRGGDLYLSQTLYAPDDPACCATGGTRVTRYSWNGHRMVVVSVTGAKKGYAPYDGDTDVVVL